MSYDVYITRAEFWLENDGYEISANEWLTLVENDPELIRQPENGEYFVIWRPADPNLENWFEWRNGNIWLEHPNKSSVQKMIQMAKSLEARVQGTEGELYDEGNS